MTSAKKIGKRIWNGLKAFGGAIGRAIRASYRRSQERRRIEEAERQYYERERKKAFFQRQGELQAEEIWQAGKKIREEQDNFPSNISDRTGKAINHVPWDDEFNTPKRKKKRRVFDYW